MRSKKERGEIIDTSKLHLVDVRFYEKTKVEVEIEERTPKAVVFEHQGIYMNVVTGEVLPYFTRAPYSNLTRDNMEFGTKLSPKNKELLKEKGICYVETSSEFIEDIKRRGSIDRRTLEDKILYSNLYFIDRIQLIEQRINNGESKRKLRKLAHKDWENNCYFKEKLDSLNEKPVKRKLQQKA